MTAVLKSHQHDFFKVVPFDDKKTKVAKLDLSQSNKSFAGDVFTDTATFSMFIDHKLAIEKAAYLIGGYNENRQMYSRSELFDKNLPGWEDKNEEPRTVHLGTDIWGAIGTKIYAPLGGMVHSFAFNNNYGDYGATIILQHQLDTWNFYTLYGHLSLKDIGHLREGQFISRGENFAHFGPPAENGNWPAHLHFQVILDIGNYEGDYPGVCKFSEADKYLVNSPDPDLILHMDQYI